MFMHKQWHIYQSPQAAQGYQAVFGRKMETQGRDEPENLYPSSSADFFLHFSAKTGRMELFDISVLCDFLWEDIIKYLFIPNRTPTTDDQDQLG